MQDPVVGRQYGDTKTGRVVVESSVVAWIDDDSEPRTLTQDTPHNHTREILTDRTAVFELTITSNGIPTLQKTEAKSPTPGGFIVKTGPDFPETDSNGNAYVLGFGKTDGATKKVAPCASVSLLGLFISKC